MSIARIRRHKSARNASRNRPSAPEPIASVRQFTDRVLAVWQSWTTNGRRYQDRWVPWFRGEPADTETPLAPKLYRPPHVASVEQENDFLQHFRAMGPHPFYGTPPATKDTHLWIYLAQHVGLPTRLLDWTEGALIGLSFALELEKPRIWMLHPLELNALSKIGEFELAWHNPLANESITAVRRKRLPYKTNASLRAAWQKGSSEYEQRYPIAFYPTYIHPRMAAQRSCFTTHGRKCVELTACIPGEFLRCFDIQPTSTSQIARELRVMGISRSSLVPDFDGLARDLERRFAFEEPGAYGHAPRRSSQRRPGGDEPNHRGGQRTRRR